MLSEAAFSFRAEGVIRSGVASLDKASESQGDRPLTTPPLTLPPDSVAVVLPLLGFSSGGSSNPNFVAPAFPGGQVDTASTTDAGGHQIVQITATGDYGEPQVITIKRDGLTQMVAHYTWVAVTGGGIRVSTANYKDTSNPDVEVRTTVTVTSANIVTLTNLDRVKNGTQRVIAGAANVCLPRQLHASTLRRASSSTGCSLALAAGAYALIDFTLSSAAFVAAGPASLPVALRYFGSIGKVIGAAFTIGAQCRK